MVSPLSRKFGVAFNEKRKELGIPVLPGNWTVNTEMSNAVMWNAPEINDAGGSHSSKMVLFKDRTPIEELDNYIYKGGIRDKHLTVIHHFDAPGYRINRYYDSLVVNEEVEINDVKADSILQAWGEKLPGVYSNLGK
jgi:hypothetical protein